MQETTIKYTTKNETEFKYYPLNSVILRTESN